MDKTQPKLSVLIPAYNAQESIKDAIVSVPLREDIEIIVYDDGSTDRTEKVAQEELKAYGDFGRLIKGKTNRGVAHAVNRLLDAARGEWVVLLGSDDYFITVYFREAFAELKPAFDLVYFNLQINSGEIWRLTEESKWNCCGSVKFMRREFVGNTRCDESHKSGEDFYFFKELQEKNPRELFTDLTVKHYNYPREGSLSDQRRRGKI